MAEYLRSTFRATDLIARLDEEQFVILLTSTNEQAAILAMEKLRTRLNEGITQHYPEVTFSIGIVSFANCAYSARQVLDMADVARFQASAGGEPAASPTLATA
jgi:diguanylate cyclase (GGDEF)-like protein